MTDLRCVKTLIGLGKYHHFHSFPLSPPFSLDPLNGQIAAHPHLLFFAKAPAETDFDRSSSNPTDPDRMSANPADLDLGNAGSLAIRLDILSDVPREDPLVPLADPLAEEKEEEAVEEADVEGRQGQGRTCAQSGQRRLRRSWRQKGQTL